MPWPDEPCEACPRRAAGLTGPCPAQTRKLGHLCAQQARGDRRYTPLLLDRVPVTVLAGGPAPVAREARAPDRPPCDYRDSCRCLAPQCLHPAKGPAHGSPDGPLWRVTAAACRACGGAARLPPGAEKVFPPGRPWEDLSWLRRWAAAGTDPLADVRKYTQNYTPAPQTAPLVGWLHVAVMGAWEPILKELLSAVERSGLRAATSRVFAGVVGPEADLSWLPPWVEVVRRDGPLVMGENSTLEAMRAWSRSAPASKCWYLHTKGASHPGNANVTAWRDYMAWANVLRWRDCAAALDDHDAAGVDYVAGAERTEWFVRLWGALRLREHSNGFPGNFWWANSAYLAATPDAAVRLDRDRWDAEWTFAGAGDPRVKVLHDARFNLYNEHYPRSRYDTGDAP